MRTSILLDTAALQTVITIAILIVGSLAVLFSLIFLGGRFVRRRSVLTRLRTGIVAAILVILLAALDIYLAITPS